MAAEKTFLLKFIAELDDRASKDVVNFSGTLGKVSTDMKRFMAVGSAAFLGVAAAVTKATIDVDNARSTMVKMTGQTGEALEEMMASARRVGRRVPEDINQVAIAASELNTRMGLTGEELEKTTKSVLGFARVSNLDVAPTVQLLGRLFNSLDLDVADTERVMDKLVFAAQNTGIGVDRLIQNIVEAGPAFETLGFGLDRSIALFAQFEKFGARPEEVISSLNLALNKLAREGFTDAQSAFEEYIKRIEEADTLLEAVTISSELFGSRVGAKVAEDIRAGRFEVDDFVKALQDTEGQLERTVIASMSITDQLGILKGAIFDAIVAEGNHQEALARTINKILDFIDRNEYIIRQLFPAFKDTIERFFINPWQRAVDILSNMIVLIDRVTSRLPGMGLLSRITGIPNVGVFGTAVNDAIITPKGEVITTHPDDYLIATKNPRGLGGGVVININTMVGSREFAEEMGDLILENLQSTMKI
jgi:hypothetical protein